MKSPNAFASQMCSTPTYIQPDMSGNAFAEPAKTKPVIGHGKMIHGKYFSRYGYIANYKRS
jgi:hypothetical protein